MKLFIFKNKVELKLKKEQWSKSSTLKSFVENEEFSIDFAISKQCTTIISDFLNESKIHEETVEKWIYEKLEIDGELNAENLCLLTELLNFSSFLKLERLFDILSDMISTFLNSTTYDKLENMLGFGIDSTKEKNSLKKKFNI